MSTGFILLFILELAICWYSHGQAIKDHQRPYRNLYGAEDFTSTPVENLLATVMGSAEFLQKSYFWQRDATVDITPEQYSVYDFIVVGAGTAGATIASRLSEIEDVRVLLIEAGPEEMLLMDIPLLVNFLQTVNDINWGYQTEPSHKYCVGMRGHRCNWPRGKVMGGSSVLNFMIATRGHPQDYDDWAKMGNDGWAYKDVLKYFKKLESIQIPELKNDTEYHNTNGPVPISYPSFRTPIAKAFVESGAELGYPILDYNGKETIGFSYLQTTTYKGYRASSNKAYLHGKQRRNLHVTKMTMVHRILFNRSTNRVIGVLMNKNGRFIKVYARKEVILSAGAIGSPQILMLSGIGPAEHLKQFGIKVKSNLPVGDNLMDHISFTGLSFTINQPASIKEFDIMDLTRPYIRDYLLNQSGPLTVIGGCESLAFVDVDNPKERKGRPNIELLQFGGSIYASEVIMNNFGLNSYIQNAYSELRNRHSWGVFPMLLKPKSRGWIRLKSKDINVKPKIVSNYLDHPEDVRILVEGARLAMKLSHTKAFRRLNSQYFNKTLPGCEGIPFDSDRYWECRIRMITMNIYHYSGTCKMGPKTDTTAVVDPRLKVIGVKGLRVADSSIMPDIISAHTNIPTYMIAEKAADMIKEDWEYLRN